MRSPNSLQAAGAGHAAASAAGVDLRDGTSGSVKRTLTPGWRGLVYCLSNKPTQAGPVCWVKTNTGESCMFLSFFLCSLLVAC